MSFLGNTGSLMAGSGMEEMLEVCCASNVVRHLVSDKAIARVLRGHLLIESALTNKLIEMVQNADHHAESLGKIERIEL